MGHKLRKAFTKHVADNSMTYVPGFLPRLSQTGTGRTQNSWAWQVQTNMSWYTATPHHCLHVTRAPLLRGLRFPAITPRRRVLPMTGPRCCPWSTMCTIPGYAEMPSICSIASRWPTPGSLPLTHLSLGQCTWTTLLHAAVLTAWTMACGRAL